MEVQDQFLCFRRPDPIRSGAIFEDFAVGRDLPCFAPRDVGVVGRWEEVAIAMTFCVIRCGHIEYHSTVILGT